MLKPLGQWPRGRNFDLGLGLVTSNLDLAIVASGPFFALGLKLLASTSNFISI